MSLFGILNSILKLFKHTPVAKKIDTTLADFGSMSSMERNHIDTYTENRIKNIKGDFVAESNYGKIWFNHQELAGYNILNTTIVSGTDIKSEIAVNLLFEKDKEPKIVLKSDETKIESNFSNVSNRWITEISFFLDEEQLTAIQENNFDSLQLGFLNKSIPFLII